MVFQKGKPRPPMKVKTCAICRKSFQPSSGAQKICGEPECKARSRMEKYLDRRAKKDGYDLTALCALPQLPSGLKGICEDLCDRTSTPCHPQKPKRGSYASR